MPIVSVQEVNLNVVQRFWTGLEIPSFETKCFNKMLQYNTQYCCILSKHTEQRAMTTERRTLPGVDAADTLVLQDGDECMEAGFVLARLGALTTQLHPVLHQVQRLDKDCGAHSG